MVLHELETSLHPDLSPALARLIVKASDKTQVGCVSRIVENNAKLQAATKRARVFSPAFLTGLGAVFLYYGLGEKNVVNVTSLSRGGFFLFGIAVLVSNRKYSRHLKTE